MESPNLCVAIRAFVLIYSNMVDDKLLANFLDLLVVIGVYY